MTNHSTHFSTPLIVLLGLVGLASGMGIGRFALTPLLPIMQQNAAVSLTQGGWLAAANYAGYLVGAIVYSVRPMSASQAARCGLVAVGLFTLAMGFHASFPLALLLRFCTGSASALVLVGISAWTLSALGERHQSSRAGWVFAGVGTGMGLAGLVGLGAGLRSGSAEMAWLTLGALALAVAVVAWKPLGSSSGPPPAKSSIGARPLSLEHWIMVGCYGTFGLGYIIPATFLPALARQLVNDTSVFGWVWPIFGAAAALSTIIAAHFFGKSPPIRIWAYGHIIMAVGVLLPALSLSLWTISFSALFVGGTFMVVTMAGMQVARAAAGVNTPRLMSIMTACFAAGQLLGPLAVSTFAASSIAMRISSFIAATLLLLSAWLLLRRPYSP